VFCAVLAAFAIAALWGADDTARQTTYSEATDLAAAC
jgi:hypothetical protein